MVSKEPRTERAVVVNGDIFSAIEKLERPQVPEEAYKANELTDPEKHVLAACEQMIETFRQDIFRVGKALLLIRDARLYRVTYSTFEKYCNGKWQLTATYANNLINAYAKREQLRVQGCKVLPVTESQCRMLSLVRPESMKKLWDTSVSEAGGGQPTMAVIKQLAADNKQFKPSEMVQKRQEAEAEAAEREAKPRPAEYYREAFSNARNGMTKLAQVMEGVTKKVNPENLDADTAMTVLTVAKNTISDLMALGNAMSQRIQVLHAAERRAPSVANAVMQ